MNLLPSKIDVGVCPIIVRDKHTAELAAQWVEDQVVSSFIAAVEIMRIQRESRDE